VTGTAVRRRPAGATAPDQAHPGSEGRQLAVCVVLAAASLTLPSGLGFDPWAWLVWGRELMDGAFSTTAGPSWKPLPVLVTAPLSLFGDAAPALWTLVARAGGLFMFVLAFRLAARFAGPAAGGVAVAALLLSPDHEARLIRHLSQANIEPLTAGLCLWAVERHLDGRHTHAVLLLGLAGLSRPEVWPFLLLYAAWMMTQDPSRWRLVVPVLVAVPALWFGGDWLGAGDPWLGAGRARVLDDDTAQRLWDVLRRAGDAVVVPVWVAAATCVVTAVRRRETVLLVLALCAAVWMIEVVAMTALLGYAGLSRFLQPAVCVVSVLAGIGAVRLITGREAMAADGVRPARHSSVARNARAVRVGLAVVLFAATLPFVVPRAGWLRVQAADAAERARIDADLGHLLDRVGGRDELLTCGAVVIDGPGPSLESRPSLAWKRDLPIERVHYRLLRRPVTAVVFAGGRQDEDLTSRKDEHARELARSDLWAAFAVRCADS